MWLIVFELMNFLFDWFTVLCLFVRKNKSKSVGFPEQVQNSCSANVHGCVHILSIYMSLYVCVNGLILKHDCAVMQFKGICFYCVKTMVNECVIMNVWWVCVIMNARMAMRRSYALIPSVCWNVQMYGWNIWNGLICIKAYYATTSLPVYEPLSVLGQPIFNVFALYCLGECVHLQYF